MNINKIITILMRGVMQINVKKEFKEKIFFSYKNKKPLLIKIGFDPTTADLHLGHSVLLIKAKQFQNFGHNVVIVIGDFTAKIGDPTNKTNTRSFISDNNILINCKQYIKQILSILNPIQTFIRFNSTWLKPMNLSKFIILASKCSIMQILERDDFKIRLQHNKSIGLHEVLYPLMQGYDSVILKPDIEIGGNDQLFNLFIGRQLMKCYNIKPQCIIMMPLLEGINAKIIKNKIVGDKMSSSLNNYISLKHDADTQFGKIMSISDNLMWRYYELLSSKSQSEINELKLGNLKKAKEILAIDIITQYHDMKSAMQAKKKFNILFGPLSKNQIPINAPKFLLKLNKHTDITIIYIMNKFFSYSNSMSKRLIRQQSVKINGITIRNIKYAFTIGEYILKIGKKRYGKLIVQL